MSTDGSQLGFAELLRLAASKGLHELDVQVTQVPDEANGGHAVVLAAVRTSSGLYRAVGEAWREELPAAQRFAVLTVAERRAKIRALCEAVGMPQPAVGGAEASAERASYAGDPPRAGQESRAAPETRPWGQREPRGAGAGILRESAAAPSAPDASAQARTTPFPRAADAQAQRAAAGSAAGAERPGPVVQAHGGAARPTVEAAVEERSRSDARPEQARQAAPSVAPEPLGPDIFQQLMRMMHQKAALDGEEITDEESHARLDSFFQRAFNHSLEEATRVEGKQTIQRLASVIARLKQERGVGSASAAS